MTTLIADPLVTAIDVSDNREPLVALASRGIACAQPAASPLKGAWAREGVADRLAAAQAALPRGLRLYVVEGYRSAPAQLEIHTAYSREVREAYPAISEVEVAQLASRYVAPLDVAPHVAGAAVDLTLINARGCELDLGTPIDATPEESDGACAFDAANISADARANRRMMAMTLGAAGLVNYPTEWWHWSFGDRYWAHAVGAEHALYGPVA